MNMPTCYVEEKRRHAIVARYASRCGIRIMRHRKCKKQKTSNPDSCLETFTPRPFQGHATFSP
jgi:hypothetical protein